MAFECLLVEESELPNYVPLPWGHFQLHVMQGIQLLQRLLVQQALQRLALIRTH